VAGAHRGRSPPFYDQLRALRDLAAPGGLLAIEGGAEIEILIEPK